MMNSQFCDFLWFFLNKVFIVLCKTRMNSDKIFEVIQKIDNDCKPKGYFGFSIAKNYLLFFFQIKCYVPFT